ncbi:alkene reductase [Nonomuraea jiangxiensis]|uniref:N-ethylmaleimide reductase n=1 Tax=Nonomuraea jiangxiensis TaxID=633440 RepID=A0A1G9IYB3_9ACTN|nr:alkene reductase [Nonomuraea jiangxiensis]SDL29824.1 N-ethylmaleimide reductase [Nonomuraea jiangxiensis]
MTSAFDPITVGGTRLANRIVMAPMTRSRAHGGLVSELTAEYYAQRASAGLIVTEGVQPSVIGQGYPFTPGLHSAEQVAAWRKVTDAVHAEGGRIFAQLLHTGRIGHPVLLPDGLVPVAPSPVAARGQLFTPEGVRDFVTPRELTEADIEQTIADYAFAARNAVEAGFDGVELHGANGYLIHQFLAPNTNRRTDGWGGSVPGRIRFAVEAVSAVASAIGGARTGLRLSPGTTNNDIHEPEPHAVYEALVARIATLDLAYLHIMEAGDRKLTHTMRRGFPGALILNPHTGDRPTGPEELALIHDGTADLIAFGQLFLANPDLPRRLETASPLNTPDPATFYGGDATGYTDYPALPA